MNAQSPAPLMKMVGCQPVVSVKTMHLSDGRVDYFVSIKVGNREVTPHVFREEYKAAYHVALYSWLLSGTDKPDLMAFDEDEWPAQATEIVGISAEPLLEGIKPLDWQRFNDREGDLRADTIVGTYMARPSSVVKGGSRLYVPGKPHHEAPVFDNVDAAKSAAQADYERRIRAALASSTVNNPATLEKSDFQKFDVEGERQENEQETTEQHVVGSVLTCQCANTITDPCIVCGKGKTLVTADWLQKMAAKEGDLEVGVGRPSAEADRLRAIALDMQKGYIAVTAALKSVIEDLELRSKNGVVDLSHGVYCAARAALASASEAPHAD